MIAASIGSAAALRRILQLLLIAALMAAPVSWAGAHESCGYADAAAVASAPDLYVSDAMSVSDSADLHFDQCCPHAQVEASVMPEVCTAAYSHPPERLRKGPLRGASHAPYRPPIA